MSFMGMSSQAPKKMTSSGFTLLEAMISVGIISILTIMLSGAFPLVRQQQQLRIAKEMLASQLRRAQQLAMNESRDATCLDLFRSEPALGKRCSDVGLTIRNHELITFADTNADNGYNSQGDYVIGRMTLPSDIEVAQKDFIYKATPPNITVYISGSARSLTVSEPLELRVGSRSIQLNVYPYGYVEER